MAGVPRSTRRPVLDPRAGGPEAPESVEGRRFAGQDVDGQDVEGHDVEGHDVEAAEGANRRSADRFDVTWSVDCETEDTFLYASIANISAMGIFVRTEAPLAVGTELSLRFAPHRRRVPFGSLHLDGEPLVLRGRVQWVNPVRAGGDNPNPGMGIRFIDLDLAKRELLVEAVRSIAYLREDVASSGT